ncbi:hypothetical protein NDU88_002171 [Pleurodeles waltl]|uniref:Uncharacterized protein n=1 Tax=Pleurodeles waltl TaxID=8319 RepID=A0AAV7WPV8_PLEWA|nr:hypothetical protein NDU88_002171 [Pleurodeles waltl]
MQSGPAPWCLHGFWDLLSLVAAFLCSCDGGFRERLREQCSLAPPPDAFTGFWDLLSLVAAFLCSGKVTSVACMIQQKVEKVINPVA